MYVRNQAVVPLFAWYLRIRIGCGTGNKPTSVPCCRNRRISDSSVSPLRNRIYENTNQHRELSQSPSSTHRSMQIFSTCGTSTCSSRMIVCSGNLERHEATHSGVGVHCAGAA